MILTIVVVYVIMCTKWNTNEGNMNTIWIESSFLFKNIPRQETISLVESIEIEYKEYAKGEIIYSPNSFDKKIGIVVSGRCIVEKMRASGEPIPLNTLNVGDAFGVIAAFSGRGEFPTNITSTDDTVIAYFTQDSLVSLMNKNVNISLNIIQFLTGRINFLNDKVFSFSCDNVEQKVAMYILSLFKKSGKSELKFNKKKAAESLNTGRTSLYRALSSLEDEKIIKIEGQTITITNILKLERKTK